MDDLPEKLSQILAKEITTDPPDIQTLADKCQQTMADKHTKISYGRFWLEQIKYVPCQFWLLQFVLILLLWQIFTKVYQQPLIVEGGAGFMLSCLSITIFLTMIPLVSRSLRYRMAEMETASYYSLTTLTVTRLLLTMIGAAVCLSGLAILTVLSEMMAFKTLLLYLLAPFLIALSSSLYLLKHFSLKTFSDSSLLISAGMLLLLVWLWKYHRQFFTITDNSFLPFIFAGLLLFIYYELRTIIQGDKIKIIRE